MAKEQYSRPSGGRIAGISLFSWLPAVFYLLNLYRMTGNSSMPYIVGYIAIGVHGLITLLANDRLRQDILLMVIGTYMVTGLINCALVGNVAPADLVTDLMLFGIMIVMFAYPMTYLQATVFFYASLLFFSASVTGSRHVVLVLTSSTNYISVLLILSVSLFYITLQNSGRAFRAQDLLPALLCFLLSIWARGRGGILSCLILLVLVTVYYISYYCRQDRRLYFIVALAVILIAGVLLLSRISLVQSFMSLGKWKNSGADLTARQTIWSAYFEKAKEHIVYLLSGAPLKDIPAIRKFNGNTHNSFLQLHANNGLFSFVVFVLAVVYAFFYDLRNGKHLMAILLLTIVVRGMSDKFIFGQYGMPVMMYLVMYPHVGSAHMESCRMERHRMESVHTERYHMEGLPERNSGASAAGRGLT